MSRQDGSLSFYFFDFDDNAMYLETPIYVKNRLNGKEKSISTAQYANIRGDLGKDGPWKDYEFFDGTYRRYYDVPDTKSAHGTSQFFVEDVEKALEQAAEKWQAPAWPMLKYACEKQRPVAIITARGHSRNTIKAGIRVLVDRGFLEREPNYLEIYAVNNPGMVEELLNGIENGAERARVKAPEDRTSPLKRIAIRNIVDKAIAIYGSEPPHRFGMSDDDPVNVDLIIKAMCECRRKYTDKRFFVISTHKGEHVKLEVFPPDYAASGQGGDDDLIG